MTNDFEKNREKRFAGKRPNGTMARAKAELAARVRARAFERIKSVKADAPSDPQPEGEPAPEEQP